MKETSRPEITEKLSRMTEKLIDPKNDTRVYWAREVTIQERHRVDYMKFKPVNNSVSGIEKGDFYCYEIKSSVEDFHSKHGHNFSGDYNYYVMPKEVYNEVKREIRLGYVGVYCPDGSILKSVKKARKHDRDLPASTLLLMMFRSAMRDVRKGKHG